MITKRRPFYNPVSLYVFLQYCESGPPRETDLTGQLVTDSVEEFTDPQRTGENRELFESITLKHLVNDL